MYGYTQGDPLNLTDPTGRDSGCQTRIEIPSLCVSQDGGGSSPGNGGSSGGAAGGGGGTIGGPGCPCISPRNSLAPASLEYFGGFYDGNMWVSTRFTGMNRGWSTAGANFRNASWGGPGHNNPPLSGYERILNALRRSPLLIIHQILTGKSANVAVDLIMADIISQGVDQSLRRHQDILVTSGNPQTHFASMAGACACTISNSSAGVQSFSAGSITDTFYTSSGGIRTISRFSGSRITAKLRYP